MADSEKIELAKAYVQIIPSMKGAQAKIGEELGGEKIGEAVGGKIGSGIKAGIAAAAVGKFLTDAVISGAGFDKQMSQVAATMGTTVGEIGELRDYAKEMGATTAFSANQSAQALNYMALAGYDAKTSMAMLPKVLDLAASGNMDLARASDMVTDGQTALGLSIDETNVLIDQMAKTASTTNTSVSQYGEALLTVGATAKQLKGGTRELSQVLGLMADNGVKASEAGTHLRNIILAMNPTTKEASEAFKTLGVESYDAQGNLRSMQDIFGDLNTAMADMTRQERTDILTKIFNKTDLATVNALLDTTQKRWNDVGESIDNAAGSAAKMADTQLDNLAGDVTIMKSAFEGLQIAISDEVTPDLRKFVQAATKGLEFATKHAAAFVGGIKAIAVGFAAAKLPAMIGAVTASVKTLTAACAANPLMLVLTGELMLSSFFDDLTNNIDEVGDAYEGLGDKQKALIDESKTALEQIRTNTSQRQEERDAAVEAADGYSAMVDELYKLDGKTGKSAEEQAKMSAIMSQLNEQFPDLNIAIDEQTGKLNKQKDAVDDVVEAMKKQALTEIYKDQYKELYTDLAKAQDETEKLSKEHEEQAKKFTAAEKDLKKARKENVDTIKQLNICYNNSEMSLDDYNTAVGEANAKLYKVQKAFDEENDALGELAERHRSASAATREIKTQIDELSTSLDTSTVKTGENSAAMVTLTDEQKTSIQSIMDEYNAAFDKQSELINGQMNLFDEFCGKSDITADKLKQNLQENIDGYQNWEDNLAELKKKVDKGIISQEFYDNLEQMGPKGAGYVEAFVKMGDDGLTEYNRKWKIQLTKQNLTVERQMGKLKTIAAQKVADVVKVPDEKRDQLMTAFANLGSYTVDGYIKGIEERLSQNPVEAAIGNMCDRATQAVIDNMRIGSPARVMIPFGDFTVQGFAVGVKNNAYKAAKSVQYMVDMVTGTASGVKLPMPSFGAASLPETSRSQQSMSAEPYQPNAVINLVIDGKTFAAVTAPYYDMINGKNVKLEARRIAR